MKLILTLTLCLFGLWAYVYAPMLGDTVGWVLEDGTWALGKATGSLTTPRGLTALTWQWVQTPQSAHLLSLGLHVIITGLVALYVWGLRLSPLTAWASSVFFLVNPIAVETAAYAASRSEQIAALGVLLACLCATLQTQRKWLYIPFFIWVGILGKDSAIVAFGLVPLTLWFTRQEWKWPAVIGLFVLSEGAHYRYGTYDQIANFPDYAPQITAWDWILVQATATWRILISALAGIGMTPDFDYDRVPVGYQITALCFLGVMATLIGWRHRLLTLCIAGLLISVAPRFLVQTPTSYLNEHQFYTPLIWVVMGVAAGVVAFGDLVARRAEDVYILGAALILALCRHRGSPAEPLGVGHRGPLACRHMDPIRVISRAR